MTKRHALYSIDVLDEVQVSMAMEGDQRAFSLLYRRWHPRLLRHARRLTGHPDDAYDIMQDAAMAIAKNIHRLHSPSKFGPWAYTIVRNHAANYIKRQQNERSLKEQIRTQLSINTNIISKSEKTDHLQDLIQELPVADQEVLFAYYSDGMSVKEISSCLRVPEGTIKSRLYTARTHLKSAYNTMKGNPHE